MSDIKLFAPQEIWDNSHKSLSNNLDQLIDYNDAITKLIYEYFSTLQKNETKSFFEIGCYPGRFMFHFGKLGYTLNGIDQSSELNDDFRKWLKVKEFKLGSIVKGDIFNLQNEAKFDVVASFGFIEHFSNFEELIDLHFQLTKPNGIVFIAVPDFSNLVQYSLHKTLDKELLNIHNLKAMKPDIWRKCISKYNHSIIFDGYFGGFDFWHGDQRRSFIQSKSLKLVNFLNKILLSKIKHNSSLYSPFYGMIVKKNE